MSANGSKIAEKTFEKIFEPLVKKAFSGKFIIIFRKKKGINSNLRALPVKYENWEFPVKNE